MVCGNILFKSRVDVEYQKNLSVCGIEKILRGSEQDSFQEKVGDSNMEFTLGNKTVD